MYPVRPFFAVPDNVINNFDPLGEGDESTAVFGNIKATGTKVSQYINVIRVEH